MMDTIVRNWYEITFGVTTVSFVFGLASWIVWRIEQPDDPADQGKEKFDDAGHDGRGYF